MNTTIQRCVLLTILLFIVVLEAGCQSFIEAGGLSSLTHPTPMLSGTVQVGKPEEVLLKDERLKDWPLNNIEVDGDVLLATIGEGSKTHGVAINLRSKEITGLDDSPVVRRQWGISKHYFVWSQIADDGINENLYVWDLFTGKTFAVKGESDSQRWPDVSGDTVVWAGSHGDRLWDIYTYNIASEQLTVAVAKPNTQAFPKIDGDWIVYLEDKNSDEREDLYLHNLVTDEDVFLGYSPFAMRCQGCTYGIANGRVAWIGWTPDQLIEWPPHFYIYDLNTRTMQAVDTSTAACTPRGGTLASNLMKWACDSEQMAGYDLDQKTFFTFPAFPEELHGKAESGSTYISGNWVIWYVVERESNITSQPTVRRARLFVAPIQR